MGKIVECGGHHFDIDDILWISDIKYVDGYYSFQIAFYCYRITIKNSSGKYVKECKKNLLVEWRNWVEVIGRKTELNGSFNESKENILDFLGKDQ